MSDPAFTILYVDDEPLLLKVTREYLESLGFIVDIADSGAEALEILSKKLYDVVIADYQMPGMDGIELLKKIRETYPDLPYILFTGRGREEVVIEAIESGADFYVQKGGKPAPQFSELAHKMKIAVQRRRDARAIRESELRFRSLIQNSTDIIRILSPEGIILFDSPSSSAILGYPEGSLLGKRAFDYIHPEDRELVFRDFTEVNNRCNPGTPTEYRIRRVDGTYVYVESVALNRVGVPGIDGIITTTHPIDDRKKAELEIRRLVENISAAYEELASTEEELRANYTELQQHQIQLAESEDRFKRFAANAQDLLYRMSLPDGKYQYASPALEALTGYTPDEFYAEPGIIHQLIHPTSKEYFRYHWENLLVNIVPESYEFQIIDRTGKMRWLNQRNVLVTDGNGNGVALEGIVTDITRQKEIEHELRKSEDRFLATTHNAGSWVWEVDPDGVYTYCSPVVEKILGYKPEELVGRLHFYDLFDPPAKEELRTTAMSAFNLREPFRDFINLNLHKNGSRVLLKTSGTPIFSGDGVFTGYCGVDEDITTIKEAEKQLMESERRYRLLADNLHDLIWTADPDLNLTYISPSVQVLLGYTPETAMELSFRGLLSPDSWKRLVLQQETWIETVGIGERINANYRLELEFIQADGIPVWTEMLVTLILDDTGIVSRIIGIARDISQRRRAETTLKTAHRQLNLLTRITRHDILNSVSVIYAYLELAEMKETDPVIKEYLTMMKISIDHIQDTIIFTRLYDELGMKDPEWIHLGSVIPPHSSVPAGITFTFDQIPVSIYADSMLERVFFNLLDNSFRHGTNLSEIRFRVKEWGSNMLLIWEDNGIGIPEKEKQAIFERGYGKNNGFGLFLVQEILSLTGITIIENGIPGEGARFVITVPSEAWRRE
jgi:PAS domain S-box-containing protein